MTTHAPPLPSAFRLEGARAWTADPERPWADWVEVREGRVTAVGGSASADLPVVRLPPGSVVIPGLVDGHLHLSLGAQTLAQLDLSRVRSRAEFERAIADGARSLGPGRWLRAFGWHEVGWGGERPSKEWLRGAGAVPCVAYRMDQHACVVNDPVLALFAGEPCPAGGEIVRDAAGEPTGLLLEQAAWHLVNPRLPEPPAEDRRHALRAAMRHCNAFGITAVGSMEYERDLREVHSHLRAHERASFTVRVRATILDREWPVDLAWGRAFAGDELLGIVGWKAFADGTLGSRTARMLAPYADDAATRGMLVEFAEPDARHGTSRLRAWARAVLAAGFSPAVHAIGDAAMRAALDAFEPEDPARIARYEHCQTLDDADLPRMAGRIASMQPLHKADDARIAPARLGESRMGAFFRFRDLARAGARLSFGSDWPIVSCDPMLGVRAAVTGLDLDGRPCRVDQNLTVEEALRAYTCGAADALRAPEIGRIAPGAHADLCVLADDPFACDWARTLPRVAATVLGGRVVHGGLAGARDA